MRKLVLLLTTLWFYPSAEAQKIIYITDSTTLRQYFMVTPPPPSMQTTNDKGRVTVERKAPETKPAPQPEHNGIPGGPIDNAATLKKELSADISRLDWAPVLTGFGYLQYRAFVNLEGRIDSLVYCLVHSDTTRTGRSFRTRDKLHTIGQEDFRATLEKEWKHTLANFTGAASGSSPKTHGAIIYLSITKAKNLQEFLSKQADDITEINLTGYGLREFPFELKRFRKLKNINLKDNYISSATIDRKDFPKLDAISFQNNLLRNGSLQFTGGKGPATINLTDNHFTQLPKTHRKVRDLHLANSSISEVSKKDLRKIKKVRVLNLYGNTLTEINPAITRLKKLKELDLYRNRLNSLPARITRLKRLETLAVSYNTLEELPAGIYTMNKLKTLYSHHNKLKNLPALPANLEILDVGHNRIEDVSGQVQPLKNLKTLDYSYNRVKGDLDFLLGLPQIKEIYLLENRYAGTEEEEKYFSEVFSKLVSRGVTVK